MKAGNQITLTLPLSVRTQFKHVAAACVIDDQVVSESLDTDSLLYNTVVTYRSIHPLYITYTFCRVEGKSTLSKGEGGTVHRSITAPQIQTNNHTHVHTYGQFMAVLRHKGQIRL